MNTFGLSPYAEATDAHGKHEDTSVGSPRHGYVDAIPAGRGRNGSELHVQDADLPAKFAGKYSNVFGNAAFEEDAASSHQQQPVTPGGAVKLMNNLFDDPEKVLRQRQQQQHGMDAPAAQQQQPPTPTHQQYPDSPSATAATRLGSITKVFFRGSAATPAERHLDGPDDDTMVQAFNEQEAERQAQIAVEAASPSRHPAVSVNPYGKTVAVWEQEVRHLLSTNMREEAFNLAAPTTGLIRCSIKRVKAFFGGTTFQMHLDNGNAFLMAARKRKKSKVSSYVLSQDLEDLKRDTDNCLAKLKANFLGTEYMLWGRTPDKSVRKGYAAEKLCINFKQTALNTTGGPRTMYVVLPMPDSGWQPTEVNGKDSLSNSLELARHKELPPYLERKMAMMCTKPPEFDESIKGFTLDFQGRVKEASVKNFQLVAWDHNTDRRGGDLLMQFGKANSDTYIVDFTYPLSIELAFAIALASIDTKLCYTV